ncbi:MAG: SRPBCC family protein [Pseudomonadota bacterium]|nr:SRPBCC family protein [Pseudomonadota bacterium]
MFLALVMGAFAGATPRLPELTEAEWARVGAGEVVMRARSEGARVTATGVVKIAASPEALWPVVLDVRSRIGESHTLADVREYRRDGPNQWFLQVDMEVLGAALRIHHRYTWDPPRQLATYTLDATRPNDLAVADGWYLVQPVEGGSVLVYEAVTEAKVPVPGWVKSWLARDQMEGLLEGIRRRAERGRRRG